MVHKLPVEEINVTDSCSFVYVKARLSTFLSTFLKDHNFGSFYSKVR